VRLPVLAAIIQTEPSGKMVERSGDSDEAMPFLLFDGNCAEAMAFYQGCLGGQLTITKVSDTPMKGQMPPGQHHKVALASLKCGLMEISATDWLHATRTPRQGNTVALYIRIRTFHSGGLAITWLFRNENQTPKEFGSGSIKMWVLKWATCRGSRVTARRPGWTLYALCRDTSL
jgi:uncharacterized glyoxalase superfamily protein PhnB